MPDPGVFDPNNATGVANGADSVTGQRGLWDLGGLEDKPIIYQNAPTLGKNNPRGANIPTGDMEQNAPPDVLVKRPINLYATDPKAYLQLQQTLFAAGFYGATPASSIPWGTDPQGSTYDAWKRVLIAAQQAQSAGHALTPDKILQQALEQHTAAQKGLPAAKSPLNIQQADPAQIAASAQTAAQSVLGHDLSDAEIKHFVSEFHAAEASYSKAVFASNQDQAGGTHVLTAPDLTGQADQFIKQGHGTEIAGNNMADYALALEQMLGSP